jgi:hypothetical protein
MKRISAFTSFALCCALGSFGAGAHDQVPVDAEESPSVEVEGRPRGGVREIAPGAAQPTQATEAFRTGAGIDLRPELFGYVKAGYFLVVPPGGQDAQVGANSGFQLINARLGLTLRPAEGLEAVVSIDGAVQDRRAADPLMGQRIVALRDAYIEYGPYRFLKIRGGQFKAPFNAETLLPDHALPFITRSVLSQGILPPEGPVQEGLALDRQVGLQLSSTRLGGDLGFEYALALVNGNGPNELFNDNNHLAPVGRLALSFQDVISVGVNGYRNILSLGAAPRITEVHTAYGGDLTVHVGGLHAMVMFLSRSIGHPDTDLPTEEGMGAMAQVRYLVEAVGVEAGARFAWYEPSNALAFDQRMEFTAMVGYRAATFPARILLQYTHRLEDPGVEIGNNSVDVLGQITF